MSHVNTETRLAIVRSCMRGADGADYEYWSWVEKALLRDLRKSEDVPSWRRGEERILDRIE